MLETSFLSLMVMLVLMSGETAGVPKVRKQLWVSTFRLFSPAHEAPLGSQPKGFFGTDSGQRPR